MKYLEVSFKSVNLPDKLEISINSLEICVNVLGLAWKVYLWVWKM